MKHKKYHEACPICGSELKHEVLLRNEHWLGMRLNIKKYTCQKEEFIQITDLYNALLLEVVIFSKDISVYVDYVHHRSTIHLKNEKIDLDNRLLPLDYPSLDKVKKKAKLLALFL